MGRNEISLLNKKRVPENKGGRQRSYLAAISCLGRYVHSKRPQSLHNSQLCFSSRPLLMERKGCEVRCGGPRCRAWRGEGGLSKRDSGQMPLRMRGGEARGRKLGPETEVRIRTGSQKPGGSRGGGVGGQHPRSDGRACAEG